LLCWLIVGTALAGDTTPEPILSKPDYFDGKMVSLDGIVTNLHATVSRRGNPYYTFDLSSGGRSIKVFSFGKPPCPDKSLVSVRGRFDRQKQVSGRHFYNEVEATEVTCR